MKIPPPSVAERKVRHYNNASPDPIKRSIKLKYVSKLGAYIVNSLDDFVTFQRISFRTLGQDDVKHTKKQIEKSVPYGNLTSLKTKFYPCFLTSVFSGFSGYSPTKVCFVVGQPHIRKHTSKASCPNYDL